MRAPSRRGLGHVVMLSEIDPSSIAPNAIVGALQVLAGILVLKYRTKVYRATIGAEKTMFGRVGRALAEHQSPVGVVIAGVGCIVLGCILLALAVAGTVQLLP